MQGGGVFIPIPAGFFCVPSVFFGFGKVYLDGGAERNISHVIGKRGCCFKQGGLGSLGAPEAASD